MPQHLRAHQLACWLTVLLAIGCGNEENTGPAAGSMAVYIVTDGAIPNDHGYAVAIGNRVPINVAPIDSVSVDLAPGTYEIRLTGVPSTCSTVAGATRSVIIHSNDNSEVYFSVICPVQSATLDVTVTTTGADLDQDGYQLQFGSTLQYSRQLPVNGRVLLGVSVAGEVPLQLTGVDPNCTPAASNPASVTVPNDGNRVAIALAVNCVAFTGSIKVTVTTTGRNLDSDGYRAMLDNDDGYGTQGILVATNGNAVLNRVPAGQHHITLEEMAPNCSVTSAPRVPVDVTIGVTAEVAFSVACSSLGSARLTIVSTGTDLDPDGYRLSLSGPAGVVILAPANGTVVVPDLAPGAWSVTAWEVSPNCRVTSPEPQQFSVTAEAETAVTINVACVPAFHFAYTTSTGNPDIALYATNGASSVLTTSPLSDYDPDWSPDGTRIAFASERDGQAEIYVMNADGSAQVRLTNALGADTDPAWSPDGRRIAFTSNRDGKAQVYVMNADGSNPTRLTNLAEPAEDPSWSPDGSRIAFTSAGGIYTMDRNGTDAGPVNLVVTGGSQPAWSPDGTRIAFTSNGIVVINVNGTGRTTIAGDGGGGNLFSDPDWSVDGSHLAFTYLYYGYWPSLMYARSDGGDPIFLSIGGSAPSWRP